MEQLSDKRGRQTYNNSQAVLTINQQMVTYTPQRFIPWLTLLAAFLTDFAAFSQHSTPQIPAEHVYA